jgi:hypothetical protein
MARAKWPQPTPGAFKYYHDRRAISSIASSTAASRWSTSIGLAHHRDDGRNAISSETGQRYEMTTTWITERL